MMAPRRRVFSGIQPSGDIHIGNYLGAIRGWVEMQDEYECLFCIVDYHAITVDYDPKRLQERIHEAALVNIAAGLDPDRCTVFVQSRVPQHTELAWILNTVTPLGDLQRMTQFKDKSQQHQHNINAGLLNYPVLQAADILLYLAEVVPVGEDQKQHIELTREIARRFNNAYGQLFPEPQCLIRRGAERIMGLDGERKMSKSLENAIDVLEDPESIRKRMAAAKTDPARQRRSDPGEPARCNIYTSFHRNFSSAETLAAVEKGCRTAGIGCLECKKWVGDAMEEELAPMRERAARLRAEPDQVAEALETGARRARRIAEETMARVRRAMGL